MRPIDADALKKLLQNLAHDDWNQITCTTWAEAFEEVADMIDETSTADVVERKVGKWIEKEVIYADEAKTAIEEWQSCRCSVCGRYDTRPYMYYFDEPHFCSWCGAMMTNGVE